MNRSYGINLLESSYPFCREATKHELARRILAQQDTPKFLRYPGGKGRLLSFLTRFLPQNEKIMGRYIEPFVGGGAVFLFQNPFLKLFSPISTQIS